MTTHVKNKNILFGVFATIFLVLINRAVVIEQYYLMLVPFAALVFYIGWRSINTAFLLLIFTLPFSIEYQFSDSLGTDLPDELLMLLVSGLLLCHLVYNPQLISRQTWNHPLLTIVAITFLWAIISSIFSTQPLLSLKYLLAKAWYIGAFLLAALMIFKAKQMVRKAATVITVAMSTVAIIALIRHAFDGFTFATINNAVQPFFRNHVNYSAMLVCVIPIVFFFMQTRKTKNAKALSMLLLTILLTALFFSYARGAWLALLVGIAAAWLIKKKLLVASYITAIILLLASICWLKQNDNYLRYAHDFKTTIWHEDFKEHIRATYELKDASTAERFYRWIAGVRMVKDNWLTGYGPNSFYYNYKPYAIPAYKTWVSDNKEHSTVHNYFLLITIEQGLPGLLFFLLLTTAMLFYSQRLYHRVTDIFYKRIAMLTGMITMMLLTVNFLSDLIETDKIGSIFFLCIALLIITDIKTKSSL